MHLCGLHTANRREIFTTVTDSSGDRDLELVHGKLRSTCVLSTY